MTRVNNGLYVPAIYTCNKEHTQFVNANPISIVKLNMTNSAQQNSHANEKYECFL